MERVALGAADDIIERLGDFRSASLEPHVALLPSDAMRSYLRMNVVRVVRAVELLLHRGFQDGEVLEVGAWFGSFALPLRRLGYDVVACDRYSSYGDAFESHLELLRRDGVRIVSTTRETELEQIRELGRFDVVLAGAVIEHVPHTPRTLLETLFEAVRPGGLLVLDTPNVARYWNRQALARGETIFQPLEDQYSCEPPWEGHHREYTAQELRWMLEHVGCEEVEVEFLDYNMLQFEELSAEHTECLAAIVEDPSQSDILLGAGRRPNDDRNRSYLGGSELDSFFVPPERFELMHRLVDSPQLDFPIEEWSKLYELTVAFRPDLVLELGRGWGNSTCVFTEAANVLGCRVVSIGFDSEHAWETRTARRLERVVDASWFAALMVVQGDITETDFRPLLEGSRRTLVFWDAHGADIAEALFDRLLPALPPDNTIVVDDVWAVPERYGVQAAYQAGPLWSQFEELLPLWDYLAERHIEFEAADRWISFTARDS